MEHPQTLRPKNLKSVAMATVVTGVAQYNAFPKECVGMQNFAIFCIPLQNSVSLAK